MLGSARPVSVDPDSPNIASGILVIAALAIVVWIILGVLGPDVEPEPSIPTPAYYVDDPVTVP